MTHRIIFAAFLLALMSQSAEARISIAPYYSIKSTKSVNPAKKGETIENEKVNQREEFGLRANIRFWRLLKFQLSVGQSNNTKTEKAVAVEDEYGEIDFQQDLNISVDDPDKDISIKETQNVGKMSFVFDPSFSIFIARFKLGITARQRIITKEEQGLDPVTITEGPTYNPHSGFGAGIRFSPRMYFMIEYEFLHYKYPPDIEPFERTLTASYSVSI